MKFTGIQPSRVLADRVSSQSAIETEFRIRVLCLQTKSLAGTPRSRKLLRIAIVGLPCFVEYADQSWHTGCLSAQTTRRVV